MSTATVSIEMPVDYSSDWYEITIMYPTPDQGMFSHRFITRVKQRAPHSVIQQALLEKAYGLVRKILTGFWAYYGTSDYEGDAYDLV